MKIVRSIEKLTEGSLLFILAAAPWAFGSVYTLAYRTIQIVVLFVFFLWGIRQCLPGFSPKPLENPEGKNRSLLFRHPFLIPFIFWVGLVASQRVPLEPDFLRAISQETFFIHQTILGGLPLDRYPLSLSSFDTGRDFFQVITCALLFYLVVSFPPLPAPSGSPARKGDPFFNSLLFTLTLTVGFQVLYALAEYFTGQQRIYFFPRSVSVGGAAGTFVNPNHFANYLLLFFPLLFSWTVLLTRPSREIEEDLRSFRGQAVLSTLVLGGIALAVIASHSRMAFFSLLVEVLLLGMCFFFSGFRKQAMGLLLGLVTGMVFFPIFLDRGFASFQNKLLLFLKGKDLIRFQFWGDCLQIVKDFPWTGTGLGTFQLIFPKYSSVPVISRLEHAHNDWLELLVETGFLGSFLITTAGVWFFVAYGRRLREAPPNVRILGLGILISLLAFMIHSLAESNFHIPANAYSFAIVLGMGIRLVK